MGYRRGGVLDRPPKPHRARDYRAMLNWELLMLGFSAYKWGSQLYKTLPAESFARNPQAYGMSPGEHLWADIENISIPELQRRSREGMLYGNNLFSVPKSVGDGGLPDRSNEYLMEAERRMRQPFGVQPPDHIAVEARVSGYGKNKFKSMLATIAEETDDIDKVSYGKAILEKPAAAAQAAQESVTILPYPPFKGPKVSSQLKSRLSRLGALDLVKAEKKVRRKRK